MCAYIDASTEVNDELSQQMLEEQKKAAAEAKKQAQQAQAATPKTMRSNNIDAADAVIDHARGVQSTYLASRLDRANKSGNNLGE